MILLNGALIKPTIFPDKTSQVWKLDEKLLKRKVHKIDWHFEEEAELIHLAQLVWLLDSRQIMMSERKLVLDISYLPYARQDKFVSNETTFAMEPFANILNSLDFDTVNVFDPHSYEACRLINNIKVRVPRSAISSALVKTKAGTVCFPDLNAEVKYWHIVNGKNTIYAEKERDQKTGEIISHTLTELPEPGSTVLIVDDICDGGATFTKLSKMLYDGGAKTVHLYVSHGLFTKGIQVLRDAGIKRIFTKNGEVL